MTMNTKRLILAGLLALALALVSAAQTIPGTTYTYGSFKPTLTVDIGTASATTTQTLTVDIGQVPGPNGTVFFPLAAGAVGQSVIVGTGTNADTVTISAVNCYTPLVYDTCSFTAASYTHSHGRGEPVFFPTAVEAVKLEGACTGAATASQTLGLYGLGQWAAQACTQTAYDLGRVVSQPGTIRYLGVAVTVAGTTASSGVFTVRKNGSDTTVTCTVGTALYCSDSSHFVTVAAGDIISVKFTTQGAETLANPSAYVLIF
jgi:hypothetical protein